VAGGRRLHGEGPAGEKGAEGEAEATGRNPTGRGKCGTKRHLLTDGRGVPLALVISGANRTDMKKLADLLDAQPYPAPGAGEERHLCLDWGYDYAACREAGLHRAHPAQDERRAAAAPDRTPQPPPAAHSWFNRFRRLLVRWEKKVVNYRALVHLAALIVYRRLRHARSLLGQAVRQRPAMKAPELRLLRRAAWRSPP